MKRLKNSFIGLLLILTSLTITIISCSNEETIMNENVATDNSIFARTENEVIKPEYFDFIGEAHNQGLEYVFTNSIDGNSNLVYSDIKNSSLNYFDNVYELTLTQASSNYTLVHDEIVRKSVETNTIFIENGNYDYKNDFRY